MTGDASRYNSPGTAAYTQRVLDAYQSRSSIAAVPTAERAVEKPIEKPFAAGKPADKPTEKPTEKSKPAGPSIDKVKPVSAGRSTPYDRYMKAGYDAEKAQQYKTALTFFRRALDERPSDTYATTAIQNTEGKQVVNPIKPSSSTKGSVVVPTDAK